jgi:uncharacterized protein YcbX
MPDVRTGKPSTERSARVSIIGRVDSLWRYPVKSMRGEELEEAFLGFPGIYGDRLYAFRNSASPKGFPYLTGRQLQEMVRYRPRFRNAGMAARPPNVVEATAIAQGATPLYADPADMTVDVETPSGKVLAIDDAELIRVLREGVGRDRTLALLRSDRALTDSRPVSLFSIQTVQQLGRESGVTADKRRFRTNIYLDLEGAAGFAEDALVGRSVRIGSRATISVLELDPRCKMVTLDPDTGESNPELLRTITQAHNGMAGIYGAVLVEGTLRKGDAVELLD